LFMYFKVEIFCNVSVEIFWCGDQYSCHVPHAGSHCPFLPVSTGTVWPV
jgi:hypothetical protein